MITLIVEAILVILLVIVLMNLFRKHPSTPAPSGPQPDLANLKPSEAQVGDVISVSGAGDEYSDLDFTVDRVTWVQAGSHHWMEATGIYRNRRVSMRAATTAEGDAEVAVHTDQRELTLGDFGLAENDLGDLDERQNTEDWFEFDNKTWMYRLSREAQATGGQGAPSAFYYWEFRERDGQGLLAIRKPEGDPFAITIYTGVAPGNVTVYRGGRT